MSRFSRFANLFRGRKLDRELEEELRSHLEMRAEDNMQAGMEGEEAKLDARRRFGNPTLVQERARGAHLLVCLESVFQDLRYGLRALRKSPAFAMAAVLSLALGVGINTAVFSIIDTLLFRQADVADPGTLVSIYRATPRGTRSSAFPFPVIKQLRENNHVFAGLAAWGESNMGMSVGDEPPEMVRVGFYSGNYFPLLGVQPTMGRALDPSDEGPVESPVAMISYQFWQKKFGGDPAALEKSFSAKGFLFKIVGVMPPGFTGLYTLGRPPDIAVPLPWYSQFKLNDDELSANLVARLKPGSSLEQASVGINLLFRGIPPDSLGTDWQNDVKGGLLSQTLELHPRGKGDEWTWIDYRLRLGVLMGVVAFVLLIACANVASLLLARASGRQKEIAVRLAIGAGRWRIARQLVTESLLLAALGGAAGLWLAVLAHRALTWLLGLQGNFVLDWRVLTFAAATSLFSGGLFGLAPALRSSKLDPGPGLKSGCEGPQTGKPTFSAGKVLVIFQVALSLMLLVATGLLVQTLRNLDRVDPGFDRDNVLLFWIFPTTLGYEGARELELYEEFLRGLKSIPGVESASMARHPLMQGAHDFQRVTVAGSQGAGAETRVAMDVVSPGFFATMRAPLLAGRDFTVHDGPGGPTVAIINRSFAARNFGHESPLGRKIVLHARGQDLQLEIVGVVQDMHYYSLRQDSEVPAAELFLPYTQAPRSMLGQMCFALRINADPAGILQAAQNTAQLVDKNLPVVSASTQAELTAESISRERSLATLTSLFSALAVLLACVGLYGVMAFTVSRRTREIGILMSLGADRAQVRGLVLRESWFLMCVGIAIGIPAALGANIFLRSLLYGVKPSDAGTFFISATLLAGVASIAAYLPARRASCVDPLVALRHE
jgi:predicted permease